MKKFLSDVLVDCNLTVSGTTSLGAATGVTVASSDNSTNLATTAFVKAQGFVSTNTTYDISVPSGTTNIRLASSGGVNDDITISAAGASTVSRVSDSEIRITSTNSVDYVSNVALNGTVLEFSGVGNGFAENVDLASINTDTNYYLNSASFNTTNGVLTLGRQGLSNITVDLDNRYLTSESDTLDTVTSRNGVTTNTIGVGTVNVTGSTEGAELLTVDGTYGRLFTVTDDLSDSLFSVNTVAGLPAFEVFADNTIKIGAFANPITIDSSSNISIPGTITASGYNDSNWNTAFNDRITAAAVSGTSTKTLTLTQGDGSTITASWTDIEGSGADGYVSNVALNGNSLDFTAVGSGFAGSIDLSGITTDLTGYATEQYVLDNSDDYGSWNLKTNGVQRTTVQSGGDLDIVAGTNVSVSYGAGGVVTISSTDTNTDTNNYLTGLSFNTGNGVLTATRQGLGDLTVDLDGRYALSSHNHDSRYIRKDIVDSFTGLTNDTYDDTPGFLKGVISLRPGSAGGTTGIGFSTTVNVNTENGQDYGYIWWYDDNNNYAFGDGSGENAALILGIQNDSSTTDFGGTQDAVVLESSANIFFNPGLAGVGTGGVGGPDFTQGKVYIGRADEAYEVYHQGNLVNVSQLTNDAGYLTSFSETDPVFTAHVSSGITATNISNWNVAYGWGDHSTAGYLTAVPSQYLTQTEGDNRYKLFSEELLPVRPEQAAPPDSYPLGLYLTDSESNAPYSWVRDAGIVWGIHPANSNNRHLQFIANHDGSELLMRMKNGTVDEWRDWNHLATRSWVSSQNFGNATESWVESRGYLTSETVTSLSLSANVLRYTDENGANTDLDLSLYLDDTNLARLTSGTLNGTTGIATFTRDDSSTFTVDFSAFLADGNNYADSLAFNTSTGVLTLGRNGSLSDLTVDLDGRYQGAGTYNTIIGTDADINTGGYTVIDQLTMTDGVITAHSTRSISQLYFADTRNVNDAPNHFDQELSLDFKNNSTIGNSLGNTYSGVMTIAPWRDTSGGWSHQLIFSSSGATEAESYIGWRVADPDEADPAQWSTIRKLATQEWVGSQNYLTSYTETDTLDTVADRGATTNQTLTVGGLVTAGEVKGSIFRDNDNTAYYVNPSGGTSAVLAGNVGIGTSGPASKLHIYQEASAPTLLTLHNHQGDITPNGTQGNFIDFQMTDGNATFIPQVRVGMLVGDTDGDEGMPSEGAGNFVVYTGEGTDSSGNGTLSEHFRITDKGRFGFGTPAPSDKLHVKGTVRVDYNDNDGTVYYTGYGVEFARGTSYLRPNVDGAYTLHIGSADDNRDWNTINLKASSSVNFRVGLNNTLSVTSAGIDLDGSINLSQSVKIDNGSGTGDAAGTVIETFDTGVFIGAFLDFTVYNDDKSAMRSGTLQLVFNDAEVMFNEVNTMDIGDTTPCTLVAVNNGGSVDVIFTTPDPTFHIKYHVRTL